VSVQIVAHDAPARGAAVTELIGVTIVAVLVAAVMVWVGYLHRARRITWLNRLVDVCVRKFQRPPWVVLQFLRFAALVGFVWDIGWHLGNGRDDGLLANPAHYLIVIGLFGIFLAGAMAIVVPYGKPGPAAVRITRHWYASIGGVLLAVCGLYALVGLPLDDLWHRMFGQDVTLWGPTHLVMLGGACLSVFAGLLLEYEAHRERPDDAPPDGRAITVVRYVSFGGLLIGLSIFQGEWDFGVEQFRLVLQPTMIAGAAALALVAARITLGPGAAVAAAMLAAAIRGGLALFVGPVVGGPINWFPLYLGPALVVELVGLTLLVKRPVLFGAVAGLGVGTVGLWLESFWIDAVYPYPWPAGMWGEALAMAVPVAVTAGLCGALLGMVLTGKRLPRRVIAIGIVAVTILATVGVVATGLRVNVPTQATATIILTDLPSRAGQRLVSADVRINPRTTVGDHPEWVSILSWQGGMRNDHGMVIDRLHRVGAGHYRSTQPIPVWGSWKALLRVQDGRTMAAVPIYMPADAAIPLPEIPAQAMITRNFVHEITLMQRERDPNTPAWLFGAASALLLIMSLMVIAMVAWGAGRINATDKAPVPPRQEPEPRPEGARSH
jgi:hypothetical protein